MQGTEQFTFLYQERSPPAPVCPWPDLQFEILIIEIQKNLLKNNEY
jgi:hypothetical protein